MTGCQWAARAMHIRGCSRACGWAVGSTTLHSPTQHIYSYQNATSTEIVELRVRALEFGVPFLLLFGGGLVYALVWSARAPLDAEHRVLTTLSTPLRRRPHPVVRLNKSRLLPFYPSPTFQGSDLYHWYDNKLLWGHVSKEALSLCSGGTSLRPRNSVSQS